MASGESGFPAHGRGADDLLAELRAGRDGDADWRNGRTFSLVYNPAEPELERLQEAVALAYLHENYLNPFAFPSLLRMERDVVAMAADLLHGDARGGRLSSGGTESIFLIVQVGSIVVGASMTRNITGAVHDLYEGTQRVKAGDFSHRIAVRGSDQLAELSLEFNHMTENLQRLIVVEKERERLHSELEFARDVQNRLFPKAALSLPALHLSGVCYPAQQVSGDYYDFLSLENSSLAMAIGDVAGKGVSSALLMATIQSAMRSHLARAGLKSPAQIVSLLNRQIYASTAPEKYATFFFGLYDDRAGMLTYTNAGHLQPILVRDGATERLEVTGTVVGAFPSSCYEEKQIALLPGDLLVAYTDGITEPEDAYGEMFGEERLIDVLMKHQNAESSELVARAMEAVLEWTGSPELQDDMTMLITRRTGA